MGFFNINQLSLGTPIYGNFHGFDGNEGPFPYTSTKRLLQIQDEKNRGPSRKEMRAQVKDRKKIVTSIASMIVIFLPRKKR